MGDKKVANSVVALSSAAVLAIYGAGYAKTRAAAERFAQQASDRRPHIPAPRTDAADARPEALSAAEPTALAKTDEPPAVAPPVSSSPETKASAPVAEPARPAAARSDTKVTPVPSAVVPKAESASTAADTSASVEDEGPSTTASAQSTGSIPTPAPTPAPAPVPATPAEPARAGFKDGTYYGWGTCRHGDIQAAVVIEDGKITTARVERCLTRYSCNWITPIPPRILAKQGTTYDYVSGATESSDAFQDAVAEALSQAK